MDNPLAILIFGAHGKLGSSIARHAKKKNGFKVSGEIGREHTSIEEHLKDADVVIDTSLPGAILPHLPAIAKAKKPLIIATTGQSNKEIEEIKTFAKDIPILFAPNFSEGVSWLQKISGDLPDGEYEIFECHHEDKKDEPSGTAKAIAEKLPKKAKMHSTREGNDPPKHKIVIHRPHEIIVIKHIAISPDLFAEGALKACSFLSKKTPGVYNDFHDEHPRD